MKLENDYPKVHKDLDKIRITKRIFIIVSSIGIFVSVLLNIILKNYWSLYVIGGVSIAYLALFSKPLMENNFIKKITYLFILIGGYLYIIDFLNKTNWSYLVINILVFSLLIIQFVYFIGGLEGKRKIIPMMFTSILSCVFCLFAIIGLFKMNWAIIVLGSVGLFNLLFLFTFNFKKTILELKKYFTLK